ncbi:hypothetical protein BD408DRAFT_425876 [Parasitella parasitica]|nr:hypothetical protein BD408DRAFT_425876 [Parasitella parasitica]
MVGVGAGSVLVLVSLINSIVGSYRCFRFWLGDIVKLVGGIVPYCRNIRVKAD